MYIEQGGMAQSKSLPKVARRALTQSSEKLQTYHPNKKKKKLQWSVAKSLFLRKRLKMPNLVLKMPKLDLPGFYSSGLDQNGIKKSLQWQHHGCSCSFGNKQKAGPADHDARAQKNHTGEKARKGP